jgi:hypothetical protein
MHLSRSSRPTVAVVGLATAVLAGLLPAAGGAQVLGLPVAQSPFGGRPLAVAVDGGVGGDKVRVGGLAIAARRPAGRLVATLGVGRASGFEAARTTYGGRLAFLLRFGTSGALGAAPFAGFGRLTAGDSVRVARSGDPRLAGGVSIVPVGVGLGYRRLLAGRPVAVHVAPQAQWWRRGEAEGRESTSAWFGRAAVGADVAVTRQIGVSLAYEAGGSAAARTAGPRKSTVGLALSYAPGRGGGGAGGGGRQGR